MFWIYTGAPGSTKTSHVIDFILSDDRFLLPKATAKPLPKRKSPEDIPDYTDYYENRRPVYYYGIRDLKLPWIELTEEQVLKWDEHIPPGAVLVVDEAQKLWRSRASGKAVPQGVMALEDHRHSGWDIVFISQEPSLLDVNIRKICNEHVHYTRPYGGPFVNEYHSGSGYVNPSSTSELSKCIHARKPLVKRVYGLYRSAEIHTHKFKPPKIIYFLIAGVALAVFLVWRFTQNFGASTEENYMTGEEGNPVTQVASVPPREAIYSKSWGELLEPEIKGLPYTAPIYEQQAKKPTAVPVVQGCMSMKADFSDCSCYTQQGTTITDMPWQTCRRILKHGIFNHLAREEENRSGQRLSGDGEARATAPAAGRNQTSL